MKSTPERCRKPCATKRALNRATHPSSPNLSCKTMRDEIGRRSRVSSVAGTTVHLSCVSCESSSELIALTHSSLYAPRKAALIDPGPLVTMKVQSIPACTASSSGSSPSRLLPLLLLLLLFLLPTTLEDSAASPRLCLLSSSAVFQKGPRLVTRPVSIRLFLTVPLALSFLSLCSLAFIRAFRLADSGVLDNFGHGSGSSGGSGILLRLLLMVLTGASSREGGGKSGSFANSRNIF